MLRIAIKEKLYKVTWWWTRFGGCITWAFRVVYKGKGEKNECRNYRSISFLSVVEVYLGMLIESVK